MILRYSELKNWPKRAPIAIQFRLEVLEDVAQPIERGEPFVDAAAVETPPRQLPSSTSRTE